MLACLALLAAGCTGADGLRAGDAASFVEGSTGEVSTDGEHWEVLGDGAAVPEGAQVRATEAEVQLALRDGTATLAPGSAATVTSQAVELERGDLLLDSNGALRAALGETDIVAGGIVRVTSGLAARVAVYEGSATVHRPAQDREVAALRQLDLSAFRLAPVGHPLRYTDDDAWDQDLLGEAIAFDGEVARLSRGLDVEFGIRPQRPAFYREFAGPRVLSVLSDSASVSRGRSFGPPSDVLLTMFVAQAVAEARLGNTIRQIADLRGSGARWGLIAVEFDVASGALVAAVDGLDSERLALAERTPQPPGGGVGAAGQSGSDDDVASAAVDGTSGSPGGSQEPAGGGSTPPDGGGGGGGGDGGGGDEPGGDDDPGDEVVSDVVTTVEDALPDDDEDIKSAVPELPPDLP